MKKHKRELATITSLKELESQDRFLQWARRREELTGTASALMLVFLPVWLLVTAMLLSMSGLIAGLGFLILCLSLTGVFSYAHLLASFSYHPYTTQKSSRLTRLAKRRGQRQLLKLDCKTGWRPRAGAKMPPGRSDSYDRWEVCIEGDEKGFQVWSQCWTYGGVWKSKLKLPIDKSRGF
jgi:hypothetical protein